MQKYSSKGERGIWEKSCIHLCLGTVIIMFVFISAGVAVKLHLALPDWAMCCEKWTDFKSTLQK